MARTVKCLGISCGWQDTNAYGLEQPAAQSGGGRGSPAATVSGTPMALDVIDLQAFYASPVGQVPRRILSARLRSIWPDLRGYALAGIGYGSAYLAIFRDEAERVIALMPATQGVAIWPRTGPSASALVDPFLLPLGDASLDRVIIVHALETCGNTREWLSEVW